MTKVIEAAGYRVRERRAGLRRNRGHRGRRSPSGDRRPDPQVRVSAVLTAPVLFAVMASDFFDPSWLPGLLSNHWLQLALVSPVMFYAGWPIHRIGWLTLRHRTADMNTLITVRHAAPPSLQPARHRRPTCCRRTCARSTSKRSA